ERHAERDLPEDRPTAVAHPIDPRREADLAGDAERVDGRQGIEPVRGDREVRPHLAVAARIRLDDPRRDPGTLQGHGRDRSGDAGADDERFHRMVSFRYDMRIARETNGSRVEA